jgi:hypothetical protein
MFHPFGTHHLECWKLSRKWHVFGKTFANFDSFIFQRMALIKILWWHFILLSEQVLHLFLSFFLSFLLIGKFRVRIWSLNTPYLTTTRLYFFLTILMFYFLKIFNFEVYVSLSGLDIQYLGKKNNSNFGRVRMIVYFK